MTIPDFQSLMLPVLVFAADRQEHSLRDTIEHLSDQFKLSDAERNEQLPSGRQAKFDNRMGWAVTYLRKAGLLSSTARGKFVITERGLGVLKSPPEIINIEYLKKYDEFIQFRARKEKGDVQTASDVSEETPEESMESAYQLLRQELIDDILKKVKSATPAFFERLVIDVLVKMGYGGTRLDAGKAIGKSGDEGIDGIINEDRLGLDVIYIQAKRWDKGTIGRPEIQKFAGALQGQRAKKGIFITTSSFTKEAQEFAAKIESRIILIDGVMLAQLMIDFNVGVNLVASYELKRLDSDYFEE